MRLCKLASLLLLSLPAVAQPNSTVVRLPKLPPTTPQGMEGGFWRTDFGFDPILRLKNVLLKQALQVTPVLYFADGTEYDLPKITLEPAGTAQVNIRFALQGLPASLQGHVSSYGMAGVSYQWSGPRFLPPSRTQTRLRA